MVSYSVVVSHGPMVIRPTLGNQEACSSVGVLICYRSTDDGLWRAETPRKLFNEITRNARLYRNTLFSSNHFEYDDAGYQHSTLAPLEGRSLVYSGRVYSGRIAMALQSISFDYTGHSLG
jgi:hypothetical protein